MEGTANETRRTAQGCGCGCGSKGGQAQVVNDYFDRVAGDWEQMREGYFGEEVRQEVLRLVAPDPSTKVADIGSGTGFLAAAFAPVAGEVHCVDASAGMLAEAKERLAGAANVRFHQADGTNIPLADGAVDAAVANMYLHHAPDPAAALREMARILRPGGRLVLTDMDEHTEEWMRGEMADLWLGFPRESVRAWLEQAGLAQASVDCLGQHCCADKPEGGRASISLFVASGVKPA